MPDRINGIQGFSINGSVPFTFQGITYTGIGGVSCQADDPYCDDTGSSPAWLIASVASRTIAPTGSANYFLEIGANGMSHSGDPNGSADTWVVFGTGSGPEYNAYTDRSTHSLPGETTDFVVQATASATPLHWASGSGEWSDSTKWDTGAVPSWTNNAFLDAGLGDNAVTVTGAQHANLTTVNGGRLHVSAGGSLASDVIVESSGAISGDGWVGSNLTLRGEIAIASTQSLMVAGTANVAGGTIGLADTYMQAPNTTATLVVLEALAGIQGTLIPPPDPQLRPGLFLESIQYLSQSITVQLRSESAALLGDFNGDGSVDAADYVVWRKNNGTQAEFNLWRAHFGQMSGSGSASSNSPVVPEPVTLLLLVIGICLLRLVRN